MHTFRDAKAMAKAMRAALADRKVEISHSEALEIVARQFGIGSWNILSAKIDAAGEPGGNSSVAFEPAVPIVRIFDIAKAHRIRRSTPKSRAASWRCTFPSMSAMPARAATWSST
jgi:hypothetical protein